jgi:hypothetical protein
MKATLEGTYAGSGGKQHIKIIGDLTTESLESIEGKIKTLEEVVLDLQKQIQVLQAQNLQASVKELAVALENFKTEQAAPAVSQTETAPVVGAESARPPTQKKKISP